MVNKMNNEAGFLSGFVMLFVVTLALMGIGGAVLMSSGGRGVGSSKESMQANYALESAMGMATEAIRTGVGDDLMDKVPFTIGGATISQLNIVQDGTDIDIDITAVIHRTEKMIHADLESRPGLVAVNTTGKVTDVEAYDAGGNSDPTLIEDNKADLPDVNINNFQLIAQDQGYYYNGDFEATADYPNRSFFNANGDPNVTYVDGDLNVTGDHVYGIFIVDGNVNFDYNCRVHGIIYTMNDGTVNLQGRGGRYYPSVDGGVVSEGNVDGDWGSWSWNISSVRYNQDYMTEFIRYGDIDVPDRVDVVNYNY
ncbi:MAG: hypothetical protein R6V04_02970 [bacterium]